MSSGFLPLASASENQRGLRPRPDQVSAAFAGLAYLAIEGERFRPASFVVALNEDDLDEAKPHHSLVAALAAACKEAA